MSPLILPRKTGRKRVIFMRTIISNFFHWDGCVHFALQDLNAELLCNFTIWIIIIPGEWFKHWIIFFLTILDELTAHIMQYSQSGSECMRFTIDHSRLVDLHLTTDAPVVHHHLECTEMFLMIPGDGWWWFSVMVIMAPTPFDIQVVILRFSLKLYLFCQSQPWISKFLFFVSFSSIWRSKIYPRLSVKLAHLHYCLRGPYG